MDGDDDELLAHLGEALRHAGPVPEQMLVAGRAAYGWRSIDEELELAALVYDSAREPDLALRGAALPRALVFDAEDLSVELEVDAGRVVGQLSPPGPGQVSVTPPTGTAVDADADDQGWFTLPTVPYGPVQLACRRGAARLVTDWVRLRAE